MPTLSDIARAAGCSTYTVSCALRGLSTVAPATRARIKQLAREMEYCPDGAAALLALRRKRRHGGNALIPVAALGVPSWQRTAPEGLWASFRETCRLHGLDATAWGPEDCATPHLPRILWSRGVKGLFLFQQGVTRLQRDDWNPSAWARFHVIKEGRGGPDLPFDLVRHSAFDFLMETLRQVVRRGHRRIGVILEKSLSAEDDLARTGAALAFRQEELPAGGWLDLSIVTPGTPADQAAGLAAWLRLHRADAAVVFPFRWQAALALHGMDIPAELAVAAPLRYDGAREGLAGCDAAGPEFGARAADLMFHLLRTGRRGPQSHPIEEVLEPVWVDGATLPDRHSRVRPRINPSPSSQA